MPVFILCLFMLLPGSALAHVKWFVPEGQDATVPLYAFSFADAAVQVWLLVAVSLISASLILNTRLPVPEVTPSLRRLVLRVLALCTGASLLMSALQGTVLAPHLYWPGNFGASLLVLEALAGVLLLFPASVFAGSLLLLLLLPLLGLQAGVVTVLEYANLGGIALCLGLVHFPGGGEGWHLGRADAWVCRNGVMSGRADAWVRPYKGVRSYAEWGVPVLRVGTGIALLTLAFTEKLLYPDRGVAFVQRYDWNFMQHLGFVDFSDALFVLSAGSVEAVLGLLLLLGSTTRLNILVISLFMLSSNITFVLQAHFAEALVEIIGHLPIIGTALVLLCHGGGRHLKLSISPMLPQSAAPASH